MHDMRSSQTSKENIHCAKCAQTWYNITQTLCDRNLWLRASQVMILQKIGLCRISRSFIFSKLQDEHGNVLNPYIQRECAGMPMRILDARFDVATIFQSLQLTRIFFNRYQNFHWVHHALAEKNSTGHSRLQLSLQHHATSPLGQWLSANSKIRPRTAWVWCKSYLGAFLGALKPSARKQHNCW